PNVQAFTDLLNRCIDEPAEHVQVAGADGGPLVIRWQRDEEPTMELDSSVTEIPASDVKQIQSYDDETKQNSKFPCVDCQQQGPDKGATSPASQNATASHFPITRFYSQVDRIRFYRRSNSADLRTCYAECITEIAKWPCR